MARNTADSTQDGPALEPGSTPTAVLPPEGDKTPAPEDVEVAPGVTKGQQISYLEEIRAEYSQYRATGPIPWGNARAFNEGDPVPASHPGVEGWLADGLIEKVPAASKGK